MSGRRTALLASVPLMLLVVVLILLAGNLGNVSFDPGALPAASLETSDEQSVISDGFPLIRFNVLRIILPLTALLALYAVYTSVRDRAFGRKLRSATITMIVILSLYLLSPLLRPPDREQEVSSQEATSSVVANLSDADSAPRATPNEPIDSSLESNWHILLTVSVILLLAFGLGVYSVLQHRNDRRRALLDPQGNPLDQLVEAAADAADRLRAGHDIRGVVRECYAQMVNILEPQIGSSACLTPREFAGALASVGLSSHHIDQLTHLFELVRYGDRPDKRFAAQALRCLDGIRQAYAATGATT